MRSYELMERIKELECLHRVSALVHKRDLDLSRLLTEIAQFIPSVCNIPNQHAQELFMKEMLTVLLISAKPVGN